ncbi:hypothetical protein FRC14_006900 [Serendipita sp. 396]|nr:hypothetical protein FRC14_006900 [Serendipita sp. 396]
MIPSVENSHVPSSKYLAVERPWLQIVLGRTSQNPINPHFPDTGIGATPITYGGNLKNTVVITISATLLTIAQRFRAAQVHYLPHPVYVESCFLSADIWNRGDLHLLPRTRSAPEMVHTPQYPLDYQIYTLGVTKTTKLPLYDTINM